MTNEATPWRPMEEAPKDGRAVWLNDDGVDVQLYRWHKPWNNWSNHSCLIAPDPECNFIGWLPANIPDPNTGFAPVVSEEMIKRGSAAVTGIAMGGFNIGGLDYDPHRSDAVNLILTAALPRAKTEAQVEREVIERLAKKADVDAKANGFVDEQIRARRASEWLRSQIKESGDE